MWFYCMTNKSSIWLTEPAQRSINHTAVRGGFEQEMLDRPVAVVAKPNRADTVSPVITRGRFGRRLNFMD